MLKTFLYLNITQICLIFIYLNIVNGLYFELLYLFEELRDFLFFFVLFLLFFGFFCFIEDTFIKNIYFIIFRTYFI